LPGLILSSQSCVKNGYLPLCGILSAAQIGAICAAMEQQALHVDCSRAKSAGRFEIVS